MITVTVTGNSRSELKQNLAALFADDLADVPRAASPAPAEERSPRGRPPKKVTLDPSEAARAAAEDAKETSSAHDVGQIRQDVAAENSVFDEPAPAANGAAHVTKEEVGDIARAYMQKHGGGVKGAEVLKAVLVRFGANKMSELKATDYAKFAAVAK